MGKKLLIFDIDGTLTDTMELDDKLYRASLGELFEIYPDDNEWFELKKEAGGTDAGMCRLINKIYRGGKNLASDMQRLRKSFLDKMWHAFVFRQDLFSEVPGAADLLKSLLSMDNFCAGIATGSWSVSGMIKLKASGINPGTLPYGHSDNFSKRSDIIQDAIDQATILNGEHFESVTYFGDGVWDMEAADILKIDFIGVDPRGNGMLRELGAPFIIGNYTDTSFLNELAVVQPT